MLHAILINIGHSNAIYIDINFLNETHRHRHVVVGVVWNNNFLFPDVYFVACQAEKITVIFVEFVFGGLCQSTHPTTALVIIISIKRLNGNVCVRAWLECAFVSLCLQRKHTDGMLFYYCLSIYFFWEAVD